MYSYRLPMLINSLRLLFVSVPAHMCLRSNKKKSDGDPSFAGTRYRTHKKTRRMPRHGSFRDVASAPSHPNIAAQLHLQEASDRCNATAAGVVDEF